MPVSYQQFYNYAQMCDFLETLTAAHPGFVQRRLLCTSPEGREIPLFILGDVSKADVESAPAYYLQANVHAQEGAGTTLALHLMEMLLTEWRGELSGKTFFIVPRVNVDGAEKAIVNKYDIRSREYIREEPNAIIPQDINGDGLILKMRIEDPNGWQKPNPDDPRLLMPRSPEDTKGPFYRVYREGLVHDFSGRPQDVRPMQARHVDFNRNWPEFWQGSANSGQFPLSEPEIRAVAEFTASHPNIYAALDVHCGGNAIFRPSSRGDDFCDAEDLALFDKIGALGQEITGFPYLVDGYRLPGNDNLLKNFGGTSNDWFYFRLGLSSFVLELGNGFNMAGYDTMTLNIEGKLGRERNKLLTEVLQMHEEQGTLGDAYEPWREFDHPQLGKVEIGGQHWTRGYTMSPPLLRNIVPNCAEFVRRHAEFAPKLAFRDLHCQAWSDSGDVCELSVTIVNTGKTSLNVLKASRRNALKNSLKVKLSLPEGVSLLSDASQFIQIPELQAGEARQLKWILKKNANPPTESLHLTASHPRAGSCEASLVF